MKERKIYKKWWFWIAILLIFIIVIIIMKYKEQKEIEESIENINEGITDFIEGTDKADSHLDEFIFNDTTDEIDYVPKITIKEYNRIKNGMTEDQVVSILGKGEKSQPDENSGFLMSWGDFNLNNPPYYRIQIVFNSSGEVTSKRQLGLD